MTKAYLLNLVFVYFFQLVCVVTLTRMIDFKYERIFVWVYPLLALVLKAVLHLAGVGWPGDFLQALIYFAAVVLLSREKFLQKCFAAALVWMNSLVFEIGGQWLFTLQGMSMGADFESEMLRHLGAYVFIRLVLELLFIIGSYFLAVVWNRLARHSGRWALLSYVLFPTSQSLIFIFTADMAERTGAPGREYMVLSAIVLVSIAADVMMMFAIRRMQAGDEARHRADFLELQLDHQAEYYERVRKDVEDMSRLRHDTQNQFLTIKLLLEDGNTQRAAQLAGQLSAAVAALPRVRYCDNSLVNAVLVNKQPVCEKNGIETEYHISLPEETGVANADVVSAFANLMDNAVNACLRLPEGQPRRVELTALERGGAVVVECANTAPADEKRRLSSPREPDRDGHGWGLNILRRLAERYDGSFTVEDSGTRVAVRLLLMESRAMDPAKIAVGQGAGI